MKKRRQIGILKYGTRLTLKKKFQAGGSFSASTGYNWREDPYEMMLLKDRLNKERYDEYGDQRGRKGSSAYGSSGRKTKTTTPKIVKEGAIEGKLVKEGLKGTRDYYNNILMDKFNKLQSYVTEYGPGILDKNDFKQLYNNFKLEAEEYSAIAKAEKDALTEAKTKVIGDDVNAIAISADGMMFVTDKNGKAQEVTIEEYTNNVSSYKRNTKGDIITYINNNFVGPGSKDIMTKYISNGAVSSNSLDKNFINPKRPNLKFKIIDGKLHDTSQGMTQTEATTTENLKNEVDNYIRNDDMGNAATLGRFDFSNIADKVYEDALGKIQNVSVFRASLLSEVLKSNVNLFYINKADKKDRPAIIDRLVKLELLSRLYDSTLKFKGDEVGTGSEITGGITIKGDSKTGRVEKAVYSLIYSDNASDKYVIDEKEGVVIDKKGTTGVSSMAIPTVEGVFKSFELGLPSNKDDKDKIGKANVVNNDIIGTYRKSGEMYTIDGTKYSDIFGSASAANSFIVDNTTIDNTSDVDLIIMPVDESGKPIAADVMLGVNKAKLKALEELAIVYNKNKDSKSPAINIEMLPRMLSGNFKDEGVEEQRLLVNQVIDAVHSMSNSKDGKKRYGDKKYNAVIKMNAIVLDLKKAIHTKYGGGKVRLQKFLAVRIVGDNDATARDGDRFEDSYRKYSTATTLDIKEASAAQDKQLDDIVEKDSWGFSTRNDSFATTVLIPVENSIMSKAGEKLSSMPRTATTEKLLTSILERKFVATAVNIDEFYDLLKI